MERMAEEKVSKKDLNEIELYAYYDKKSDFYDVPFPTRDEVAAKRKLEMDIGKEGSLLNQFSEDFQLYRVGTFNMKTGEISSLRKIVMRGDNKR